MAAPVEVREKLAFDDSRCAAALGAFRRAYPDAEIMALDVTGELTPPGMHGFRGRRQKDYGIRKDEKQKLRYHFGLTEFPYYTVLFSVSRAMGMLSQMIWNRAVGTAITRPKSVSMEWIRKNVK